MEEDIYKSTVTDTFTKHMDECKEQYKTGNFNYRNFPIPLIYTPSTTK